METLYDVLGARPDDDAESLKNAYRRAVKANHPDRHARDPEAAARFKRIVTAYATLRDGNRRAAYDRLLEGQRLPIRSKAGSAIGHPAYQFGLNALVGVVVGMLAGGGYFLFVLIIGDVGGMTAGEPPRMIAAEPAPRADTATPEAPSHGPARAPGPSAPDAAGRSAYLNDTGPKAAAGDAGRDHGAEPPAQPQPTEPKTAAMSQDGICKRDAAQLAHLRVTQERDEVIRFERELGCEKLRPQVVRLRESVDPRVDPTGPKVAGAPSGDHRAEPGEQLRSTEPKTAAMSQDEICNRDPARLEHLHISQGRDEVRFERELRCDKLHPQIIGLRESVAPTIDPAGPKAVAAAKEEICKRDAAQLEHLRISQGRNEVIRFERELGCEKLRPQVARLRESVDPQ